MPSSNDRAGLPEVDTSPVKDVIRQLCKMRDEHENKSATLSNAIEYLTDYCKAVDGDGYRL